MNCFDKAQDFEPVKEMDVKQFFQPLVYWPMIIVLVRRSFKIFGPITDRVRNGGRDRVLDALFAVRNVIVEAVRRFEVADIEFQRRIHESQAGLSKA